VGDHSGGIHDLQSLARALGGVVSGKEVLAPGPGHSAKDRSLSVTLDPKAPDGFIVNSFAGDDPIRCKDFVREKAGLPAFNGERKPKPKFNINKFTDTQKTSAAQKSNSNIDATYDYVDEKGELLYQVVRFKPKRFVQRRPKGNGAWIWDVEGCRRVPYRLPDLLKYPDASVFVCEGEKDADRVASLNQCATTVACGDWTEDCITPLAGRDVLILEDHDDAGRKKALEVAQALHGQGENHPHRAAAGLGRKG
jgi:hypothetical protein